LKKLLKGFVSQKSLFISIRKDIMSLLELLLPLLFNPYEK
jgi:hypothetical protein